MKGRMIALFKNLFLWIQNIIFKPNEFWSLQKQNQIKSRKLLSGYFFPLLLLAGLAVFTGEFFRSNHFYAGFALMKAARVILLFLLQYLLAVFFTNELIKTFGGEKNRKTAQMLVVFSLTPFLLVSIITGLFPFLYVLDALGLYSFFIFWIGAKEMLVFPEKKFEKYALTTILVNFFIFSFLSVLLSKLLTAYL
jgi:hypothetical protein